MKRASKLASGCVRVYPDHLSLPREYPSMVPSVCSFGGREVAKCSIAYHHHHSFFRELIVSIVLSVYCVWWGGGEG